MNETQRRIRAYKTALPNLRERVIAVALLLAMSVAMMTSATFAWITISRAPEVSGVSTTVAANGNLEIALAQGDGKTPPGESMVGDSSAAENQTITGANVTWGNLVNLSDPIYGLDQISLRPALLSEYNLSKYPLSGASYGRDGRVIATTDRYEFTSWTTVGNESHFMGGDKMNHGVRAIASVAYENVTGNAVFTSLWNEAEAEFSNAKTGYIKILTDDVNIYDHTGAASKSTKVLGGLLSVYAQDLVNGYLLNNETNSNCSKYIVPLYNMMLEFRKILLAEGKAMMYLANLQAYVNDPNVGTATYKDDEVEEFLEETDAALSSKGITLVSFSDPDEGLRHDWRVLNEQIGKIEQLMHDKGFYNENGTYKTSLPQVIWDDFDTILNEIVDIVSTEMDETPIGSINGSNVGNFANAVLSGNPDVLIKKGIIRNFEKRTGVRMADKDTMGKPIQVTVTVTVFVLPMSPTATVRTDAAPDYYSIIDKSYTEEMNNSVQGGEAVGEDTFGMAVDLWVRTNTPNVVLTLEGSATYTSEPETGKDRNGNTTNLYVLTVDGVGSDIYKITENGTTTWYYASSHEQVDSSLMTGFNEEQNQKMKQIVSGYHGENRIWENWEDMLAAGLIMEDNTTQGAGSCFVFYADGPSEQERIKDLLNAFTVAFLDGNGERLGTAMLRTDLAYAVNGKVTVPLEMVSGTTYTDENGEEHYGVLGLNKNEPTRISAIVYLNGMRLQNENVLAEGEIEGNLNLQFGSSVSLTSPGDEKLQQEYRTLSAVANAVTTPEQGSPATSNSASAPIQYSYDGKAKQVRVDLTVDGEQPETVYGFFVRSINATQGSRGESVAFNPNEDGTWSGTFNLTTPGNYVLRSLIVNGAEYLLDETPAVEIAGFAISNVTVSHEAGIHMTADKSVDVTVSAVIDAEESLRPQNVRAQFRSTDNQGKEFNALMTYDNDNDKWVGTATINSSGTYTLQYLVIDGQYRDVPEQFQTTLIMYLGMTARIYSDHVESFEYTGEPVTIPVQTKIWDDSPTEIHGLTGVTLYYHVSGSALDQNGMYAAMTWNDATGYYEGNLELKTPGIYSFDRLQVITVTGSSSTIRNAAAAPVFTAVALESPDFREEVVNEYQFAPIDYSADNDAALTVKLENASSASVWAKIIKSGPGKNNDGSLRQTTILVEGTRGDPETVKENGKPITVNSFTFVLPADPDDGQDGEWVMTDLYLQNVYVRNEDAAEGEIDGRMYPLTVVEGTMPTLEQVADEDTFYHIGVSNKGGANGIYTYVVSTIDIAVMKNGAKYTGEALGLSADGTTVTAGFLEEQKAENISIILTDWNGRPITEDLNVTWKITYSPAKSYDYGRYTGTTAYANDVALTHASSDSNEYTVAEVPFLYAGEYTSTVTVSRDNVVLVTLGTNDSPKFTLSSNSPTVRVTKVDPDTNKTFNVNINANPESGVTAMGGVSNYFTEYLAVVYMEVYNSGLGTGARHDYRLPKVTLTLSDMPDTFQRAYLTVSHPTADYAKTYTFTPGTGLSAENEIGHADKSESLANWNPAMHPAGEQTVNQITVEYGDLTLTADLSREVTINQPQYPPYVDFSATSTDGVALNSTPSRIIAVPNEKGEFEVTLPTSQSWTTPGELIVVEGWETKSDNTDYVYRTWSQTSGCSSTTYYVGYDRRTVIEESIGSTTTWTNNYTITGWKIGTETPIPGETVKITSNKTVTAVLSYLKTNENTVNENLRRTNITYTETMSQTASKDSKYTIDIGTKSSAPENVVNKIEPIE